MIPLRLVVVGILLGWMCTITVRAQVPVLYLTDKMVDTELWKHPALEYLADTSQKLTVQQLRKDSSFFFKRPLGISADLGFNDQDVWLRFKVKKQTDRQIHWVISNDYPMVEELDVFVFNEQTGEVNHQTLKEAIPGYQRNINVHQCAIPLELVPHVLYSVYIKLRTGDAKKIQFRVAETYYFYETYLDELWFWSGHLGFVICMIVVQLVFLLVTKERNFLLYLLFLMGYLLVAIVGGYGIIDQLLWPNHVWMKGYSIVIAVVISNFLGVLFYAHALHLRVLAPTLYKLMRIDAIASVVLSVWIFFFEGLISPNVYSCAIIIVFFCLVSISCIVSYRRGNPSAIYYLFGTLSYFIGVIVVLMWTLAYLTPNLFVINAMHIGSMFEMVFFMWALADDYRRTREEREQSQKELIHTLRTQNEEISKAQIKGQTLERKRVAADLHDSLGGTLSAIRWTLSSINSESLTEQEKQVYESLVEMTNEAQQRVRFLSHNLVPENLEADGLAISVEKLTEKLNRNNRTRFKTEINLDKKYDKQVEFELYSISLELINNIIKHSRAKEAVVRLYEQDNHLHLDIEDDGVGMQDYNHQGKGLGNIQERISSLRGTWQIESNGKGTHASAQVPIS